MKGLSTILKNKGIDMIVISGDYCSGKTFVANLIKDDLNVIAKFNKLDFITRKILYVLNINPLQIGYNIAFISKLENKIWMKEELNFLQKQVGESSEITTDHLVYFIKNCLMLEDFSLDHINIELFNDIVDKLNIIHKRPKELLNEKDKAYFYWLTKLLFDRVYSLYFDFNIESNMWSFISNELGMYMPLFDEGYLICYYAYNLSELTFFHRKDWFNLNSLKIFVDMDYHLKSQFVTMKYNEDETKHLLDFMSSTDREKELEKMKSLSDITIKNNVDFDYRLRNKIINYIDMI